MFRLVVANRFLQNIKMLLKRPVYIGCFERGITDRLINRFNRLIYRDGMHLCYLHYCPSSTIPAMLLLLLLYQRAGPTTLPPPLETATVMDIRGMLGSNRA